MASRAIPCKPNCNFTKPATMISRFGACTPNLPVRRPKSSGYNLGLGLLRTSGDAQVRAVLGKRHNNVVAGLAYLADDRDRCVRLVDSFSTDDLSIGALF